MATKVTTGTRVLLRMQPDNDRLGTVTRDADGADQVTTVESDGGSTIAVLLRDLVVLRERVA